MPAPVVRRSEPRVSGPRFARDDRQKMSPTEPLPPPNRRSYILWAYRSVIPATGSHTTARIVVSSFSTREISSRQVIGSRE